jgi:TRAP-type C4-dicarboxylate transport system substrate-binding protein
MNKRIWLILISSILLVVLILSGCSKSTPPPATSATTIPSSPQTTSPVEVKPIELKITYTGSKTMLWDNIWAPWIDKVKQQSGGKLIITPYFAGQIVPIPETYNAAISGTVDIATGWVQAIPSGFDCTLVMQQLRIDASCLKPSTVAWELYQTRPEIQKEFSQTEVLVLFGAAPTPPGIGLALADKEVKTLEDMKGLKIQALGKWGTKLVQGLGAAPMNIPPGDLYTSLEKKLIDGYTLDPLQLDLYKLYEVSHYYVQTNLTFNPVFLVMNKASYNNLPPDMQKLLKQSAIDHFLTVTDTWLNNSAKAAIKNAVDNHVFKVIYLAPEEMARWVAVHEKVRDEWVAEMDAKGLPGRQLLQSADSMFAKYAAK